MKIEKICGFFGVIFLLAIMCKSAFAAVPPEIADNVTMERVTFKNRINIEVVGNLYMPKDTHGKKLSAIVVGPPFGSVKEQTSGLYAEKLAEMGYAALAFDPSFRGESGGEPRQIDVPEIRVEDFSAAVDFLSNHEKIDKNKIGVLGICASGSYSCAAAQIDHRIKAWATVSMFDIGRARREGLGGTISYEQRMKTLDEIGEQRTREFAGEPRRDINSIPTKLTDDLPQIRKEFYEYYRTPRGGHPRATNSYSFTSLAPLTNFFAFNQVETISPRPILFIVGEKAESAYFSEDIYKKAAEPKEFFVVPGATHVDLYDVPQYVNVALKKLDEFFTKNLK
ncbi:MAG: alpha/beta hydrolase [Selenomonadaceae bacterium]|nr:alpha/beta hydrolase [Selenomonadaceae bacterium]